ncbi:MAG: hypothetical protein AB1486_35095, partial [Planctomycetota bacterium]
MKCLLPLFLVLLSPSSAQAATWVVANDGSGDFTELQAAVDAASPGDLILVKDGTYAGALIQKALSIVGSGPDRTVITEVDPYGRVIYGWGMPTGDLLVASLRAEGKLPLVAGRSPTARFLVWDVELSFGDDPYHGTGCGIVELESCWINRAIQLPFPSGWGEPGVPGLYVSEGTRAFVS